MSPVVCDPKKRNPHRNSVLRELRDMQLIAMELIRASSTKPAEVAQLMRAHVAAEQQRNVLRMRPAPKPIDVSDLRKRKTRSRSLPVDGPTDPTAPGPSDCAPRKPAQPTPDAPK